MNRIPALMAWSSKAQVMARPFRSYERLATEREGAPAWRFLRGPLEQCLLLGGFVSLTAAGRLVPEHLVFAPLFWLWLSFFQVFWIAAAARALGSRLPVSDVVDLHYAGHGPWWLFVLALTGACLFVPDPWSTLRGALLLLFVILLAVQAWSFVLTFALFRSGLGLSARGSLTGTALYYAGFTVSIVGYYVIVGQLGPLLGIR